MPIVRFNWSPPQVPTRPGPPDGRGASARGGMRAAAVVVEAEAARFISGAGLVGVVSEQAAERRAAEASARRTRIFAMRRPVQAYSRSTPVAREPLRIRIGVMRASAL